MSDAALGASFRDRSGFVFRSEGVVYRQVNQWRAGDYEHLISSGLYERLTAERLLIPHEEVEAPVAVAAQHYRTLRPRQIDFVSYPYEWCFSQLKDAALTMLRIQREALAFDMTLKDASAYNIQFHLGHPLLIDTLSFECYQEGNPWVGYRQFCQHFLAPLALMSLRDIRLSQLFRVHLDGVPLDLAASLLPARSWSSPSLLLHIWLHARYQRRYQSGSRSAGRRRLAKSALLNLIRSLEASLRKLSWKPEGSEWADYYSGDSYAGEALEHKKAVVARYLDAIGASSVWDLGSNTGVFSRIASQRGARVVAFDADPASVERNYLRVREQREENLLPLLLDLTNPSPAIGWANRERSSLVERKGPEAILALALIHHLAISNNLPLAGIASFLATLTESLVIEFVPKSDPKVETLLSTREDVFPDYTREGFEAAFRDSWETQDVVDLEGSERTLYLLRRRAPGETA